MKIINVKCNVRLGKFPKDSTQQVAASDNGTPIDRFWRNRIKDAVVDNCCEIVTEEKKVVEKKK